LFFLISGFYSFYTDNNKALNKYKTRIIRLLYLSIISNIMYFVFFLITKYDFNIISYLTKLLSSGNIFKLIILNLTPTAGPLWFIQALLYCYILVYIISKCNMLKYVNKLYVYIPILLISSIMLGEMSHLINLKINIEIYRNFLFMGLPFFLSGYLIHEYENKIKNMISNNFILYSIIPCCLLIILETIATGKSDIYIGTIILTILIFIWAVKNPDTLNIGVLEWIGGKLYVYMYILHYMVIKLLEHTINLNFLNSIIYFIITAILSIIVYFILDY